MTDRLSDCTGNGSLNAVGIRGFAVSINDEHLGEQQQRPHVIACAFFLRARADPAVLALTCQNRIDVFLCACDAVIIPQKIRQRHKAVEPIRDTLPALAAAADPARIADIGPDFVKVARKSVGFGFELIVKPAGGGQVGGF